MPPKPQAWAKKRELQVKKQSGFEGNESHSTAR